MIKKKFYIFVLIGLILNYSFFVSFSYAILPVKVPVYDSVSEAELGKINEILGSMNKFLTENIQKLNDNIQIIINSLIEDKINKIISDSLQEKAYIEYSTELEKIIEKNTIKSEEDIEEDIEEAKLAGIILALRGIYSQGCIPADEYENVYNHTIDKIKTITDVDFSEMAKRAIETILICEPSFSYEPFFVRKPTGVNESFLAKLLKPFNISLLAKINPTENINSEEVPSFKITPAFQSIEDSGILIKLKTNISDLIEQKAIAEADIRRSNLGNIRPIEECADYAFIAGGNDGGKLVCLNYRKIVDLNSLKDNLKNNNPLISENSDTNVYIKRFLGHNLLSKLGLTTSTLSSISDLTGSLPLDNNEELTKLIDQVCSTFSLVDANKKLNADQREGSRTISYVKCLQTFQEKIKFLIEIEKKKVEDLKAAAEATIQESNRLKAEAEYLEAQANQSANCRGASKDLTLLKSKLDSISLFYSDQINGPVSDLLVNINKLRGEINRASSQTQNLIHNLFALPLDILNQIDYILNNFGGFFELISQILSLSGFDLPIVITIINDISRFIQSLKKIFTDTENLVINEIAKILKPIYETLNKTTEEIQAVYNIQYRFYQGDVAFSRSTILNDNYKLNEIRNRLKAYRAYIDEKCRSSSQNLSIENQNNKRQVIVVKQKEEKRGLSLLNIFKWNSFEITFQK